MYEDWSAMCKTPAPWQTPQQIKLCRLPDGHNGDHERHGRTWPRTVIKPKLYDTFGRCVRCYRPFGLCEGLHE